MITSTSNQQVKDLQMLAKKARERNKRGVFLVEGIKMFQEAPAGKICKIYISKRYAEVCAEYFNELIRIYADFKSVCGIRKLGKKFIEICGQQVCYYAVEVYRKSVRARSRCAHKSAYS